MSWDNLWEYFNRQENKIKYEIWMELEKIGIREIVGTKVEHEVFGNAPADVKRLVKYSAQNIQTKEKLSREKLLALISKTL